MEAPVFPSVKQLVCTMSVLLGSVAQAVELSATEKHERVARSRVAPTPCCSASVVPAGNFELEANYSGDGVRGGFVHTGNLTLKYSVTDRVQFQLAMAKLFVGGSGVASRGFDGVSPGLKYVFFDGSPFLPQLAVSAHAVVPTLTIEGATQTTTDASVVGYASKDLGPIHLDATMTLLVPDLTGAPFLQGGASLTGTWNFSDHCGVASGPYSTFGHAERAGVDGGWFAALNFSPFPELALSVGAEVGFFQRDRAFSVFGGVAWVPSGSAKTPLATRDGAPQGDVVALR